MTTAGASTGRHGGFNDVHQPVGVSNKPLGSQVMSQATDNYNDLPEWQ